MIDPKVDIKENDIFELSTELLNILLKDHSLSTDECQVNIFWATDNYANRGKGYQYGDRITIDTRLNSNNVNLELINVYTFS